MSNILNDLKEVVPGGKLYDDLLSPGMKEFGEVIKNSIRVGRFVLAPIDYLAAYQGRFQRYLKKIEERVPEENLTTGHISIVAPTIEGLLISEENSLISELFLNLLSNSIDITKQDLAHPSFPNIVRNISHDEAVILYYLKKRNYKVKEQSDLDKENNKFINRRSLEGDIPADKLTFPSHIRTYMSHLHSLALCGSYEYKQQEYVKDENNIQTGVIIHTERMLNKFGKLFADSCVPDEFEGL